MCVGKTAFWEVRNYEHHCTVVLVTCGPLTNGTKYWTAVQRTKILENQREIISFGAYTGYGHHCTVVPVTR